MATTLDNDRLLEMRGNNVVDPSGSKIGSFDEVYLDRDTGAPEWAAVKTGMFGTSVNLVPLERASERDGDLQVAFEKDAVKNAPNVDVDEDISEDEERRLYEHYGLEYSAYHGEDFDREERRGVDTGRGQDIARDTSGPETDSAMTRSEQEVEISKHRRERGRVRLRKYVETDTVTKTVPVEREKVRLEREPVTDDNVDAATSGPDLSDEEAEVTLTEEEVDVQKRTVPKERVRLETDVETEEREVSEEVGRERLDVQEEGDVEGDVRR